MTSWSWSRRDFLRDAALFSGAGVLLAAAPGAQAQALPSRPVTPIVPFPAGCPRDRLARPLPPAAGAAGAFPRPARRTQTPAPRRSARSPAGSRRACTRGAGRGRCG